MRAWSVTGPGPLDGGPLRPVRKPVPVPAADELLVRVRTCGVCRTDLHVTEGDLPVRRRGVTPAHDPEAEAVPRPLPRHPADRPGDHADRARARVSRGHSPA
ncbi:hypothetical protein GCM10010378_46720 [Streptomyces viridochromogenes]